MSENNEAKIKWHTVHAANGDGLAQLTHAMNTATGVRVHTEFVREGVMCTSSDFMPGEHWDPEAGEFVSIRRKPLEAIKSLEGFIDDLEAQP